MSENKNVKLTRKERKAKKQPCLLPESERLKLQSKMTEFMHSNAKELILPNLTNEERKYLHDRAPSNGLKTKSYGPKDNRILHISRKISKISLERDVRQFCIRNNTRDVLVEVAKDIHDLGSEYKDSLKHVQKKSYINRGEILSLPLGPRLLPPLPKKISTNLYREKQELPICCYESEIMKLVNLCPVCIINGETGSGKTTQVPQFILNEASRFSRPCRIIVTQPRRVAAVSIAHRVAEERGERIGDTVGYQIRMESRVSKTTNLIYTTSGFLLRSIMSDKSDLFQKITHLIIDEIHERDKYTDFTLIAIKEHLKHNRDLRVILMSATMDINQLSKYFDDCPVLNVPGQMYDVKIFHLEDILLYSGYRTDLMEKYLRSLNDEGQPNQEQGRQYTQQQQLMASLMNGVPLDVNNDMVVKEPIFLEDAANQDLVDRAIDQCLERNRSMEELYEIFDQINYYMECEDMPVDVGHSQYGMTPLMVACKCNCPKYVHLFLQKQASCLIKDAYGYSAYDYALGHPDGVCKNIIENGGIQWQQETVFNEETSEKHRLLRAYQMQFNDDYEVDHYLILSLLEGLHRSAHRGAIMVFLPGYADIIFQRDLIQSTLPNGTFRVCILHGQMDSKDQFDVLKYHPCRKIILSTNIGQTSITIPDLAFVIDSGKVKMKSYDSITESSQLRSVWISQADANQRSGRAGRTQNGVCYRLYSLEKFKFMPKFCIPEFMRISLTELCLYAKTFYPQVDAASFLAKSLNPPSKISVDNAIKKLQILEVFSMNEEVTVMGHYLADLPLDVQLGKCLLYSIFLKCFDPVLTIVSFLSIKDPYIIPADRAAQGQASFLRKSFAGNTNSDCLGILELYKSYTAVRYKGKRPRDFCNKYFLSYSAMEMFLATRRQLADLLANRFVLSEATAFNNNMNMVRYCLTAGFYPNVALINRKKKIIKTGGDKELVLQRTSALMPPGMKNVKDFIDQMPHDWIVFYEKARVAKMCAINMNTVIPDIIIALQCGRNASLVMDHSVNDSDNSNDSEEEEECAALKFTMPNEFEKIFNRLQVNDDYSLYSGSGAGGKCCGNEIIFTENKCCGTCSRANLKIDDWIEFSMKESDASLLYALKVKIKEAFNEFMLHGHTALTAAVASALNKVLSTIEPERFSNSNSNKFLPSAKLETETSSSTSTSGFSQIDYLQNRINEENTTWRNPFRTETNSSQYTNFSKQSSHKNTHKKSFKNNTTSKNNSTSNNTPSQNSKTPSPSSTGANTFSAPGNTSSIKSKSNATSSNWRTLRASNAIPATNET